ncbi:hypothetical protein C3420_14785 [Acinetobacter sp. ACNIH3]|jgi:hypothetical protein|uniref:hypothetical protein n=1 Tax=Acinetobacter TaxID=469 RepID=UPI000CDD24AB|nr:MULTISPECIES: hypothetical protein [unclassified Acinetobacter]POU17631.1 hypothetical protein C3420_14785 [Acinetobacter sp. ACNIH3]POV74095.1 hypothetical protein C3421_15450 [Acinetobacter sp. ACNIH4]
MTKEMIDVQVKNQYGKILNVKALLRAGVQHRDPSQRLEQQVEYIVVDDEIIRPTIELLFASEQTDCIYRVMEPK